MVLLPPLEDLKEPPHFDVAADDGIEAAAPRALDEVVREARQEVARRARRGSQRRGGRRDLPRHAPERRHVRAQAPRPEAERLQDDRGAAADLLRQGVEQVLDLDRPRPGLLLGPGEELQHRVREIREAGRRLVHARERRLGLDRDVCRVGARAAKYLLHAPIAVGRPREEVQGLHLGVLALVGEALRAGDEGLGVRRVTVEVNRLLGSHCAASFSTHIGRLMGRADVTIYTTSACAYCMAAKNLLKRRNIGFEEIDVTGDDAKRAWLVQTTGRRTVPQIFIRGDSIGGYDELAALDRAGSLAPLVA